MPRHAGLSDRYTPDRRCFSTAGKLLRLYTDVVFLQEETPLHNKKTSYALLGLQNYRKKCTGLRNKTSLNTWIKYNDHAYERQGSLERRLKSERYKTATWYRGVSARPSLPFRPLMRRGSIELRRFPLRCGWWKIFRYAKREVLARETRNSRKFVPGIATTKEPKNPGISWTDLQVAANQQNGPIL